MQHVFSYGDAIIAESTSEQIGSEDRFPDGGTQASPMASQIQLWTCCFIAVLFQEPAGSSDGCFEFDMAKP
jgi:hypothetical protein